MGLQNSAAAPFHPSGRRAPEGWKGAARRAGGRAPGAGTPSQSSPEGGRAPGAGPFQEKLELKRCVFCEIVRGDEPASIVYKDDRILAFLSIRQTRPGELLLIPRAHIDEFCDVPDELASHMIVHANRLSRALRRLFRPQRMGLAVHGFGVPHVHLIILPQHDPTDIISGRHVRLEAGEIQFSDQHLPVVPRSELDAIAERVRRELEIDQ